MGERELECARLKCMDKRSGDSSAVAVYFALHASCRDFPGARVDLLGG